MLMYELTPVITRLPWKSLCLAAVDINCISTYCSTYFLLLMLYVNRVVCRMLGLSFGYVMSSNVPGHGTIWLDDVLCTGSERSIIDCDHRPWGFHNCDHNQDVGIVCGEQEPGNSLTIWG